jgi:excisionase family DNA binding protein
MKAERVEFAELLTPEEVCSLLRIKKQRLYEWVHFKQIPYVKVGRFLRFSSEALRQWLAANSSDIMKGDDSLTGPLASPFSK